jgi:general secretion pathway protein I
VKNFRFPISDFRLAAAPMANLRAVMRPNPVRRSAIGYRQSNIRSASPAFTLVEVLMAIMIFAFSAVILASAYVNVLNGYLLVERQAQSNADLVFARSFVLTEPDRKKLEQGGEFDTTNGRHARWEVEIVSTATADLFTVKFTCTIGASGEADPQKTVETFTVLRPTWSIDPSERSKLREEAKQRILEIQAKKT